MVKTKKKVETADGSPLLDAFAGNLRRLRERMDLTQENLAVRAAFTSGYISQLERGLKEPAFATVEHLARALGVEPHTMFRPGRAP